MSQIATTIEQSKRLLKAGLDPGSADMKHTRLVIEADGEGYFSIGPRKDFHIEVGKTMFEDEVPAWSLSRLWDAFGLDILGGWFSLGSHRSEDVIEELVCMLENRHANH